jgi:hypothetical protein
MPSKPRIFPPRNETLDQAEERAARIDAMLARIKHHEESALSHQLQAEHDQREADRHLDLAARNKANSPSRRHKRR